MIDLDDRQLMLVRKILDKYSPGVEVRVFGSRVRGTASQFSDLDLTLVGPSSLPPAQLEALRDAFAESDLSIVVDVHDWHALSDSFREAIESSYEVMTTV